MSHQTDGLASREAYDAVRGKLSLIQRKILDYLSYKPLGATDLEIEKVLNLEPKMNTRTRRNELVSIGLVVATGHKRKSMHRGAVIGRKANVWVHAKFAEDYKTTKKQPADRTELAEAAEAYGKAMKRLARELRTTDTPLYRIIYEIALYDASEAYFAATDAFYASRAHEKTDA